MSKHCPACNTTKADTEFYTSNGRLSGKCKECAKQYQREWLARKPEEWKERTKADKRKRSRESHKKKPKDYSTKRSIEYRASNPEKSMLYSAKHRAKEKGLPFNLESKDINIPVLCPILKIPLVSGGGYITDDSPTLDRMIPHLGYVKGNVKVISGLANRIKSNANSMQILAVADYVKQIEQENI